MGGGGGKGWGKEGHEFSNILVLCPKQHFSIQDSQFPGCYLSWDEKELVS